MIREEKKRGKIVREKWGVEEGTVIHFYLSETCQLIRPSTILE